MRGKSEKIPPTILSFQLFSSLSVSPFFFFFFFLPLFIKTYIIQQALEVCVCMCVKCTGYGLSILFLMTLLRMSTLSRIDKFSRRRRAGINFYACRSASCSLWAFNFYFRNVARIRSCIPMKLFFLAHGWDAEEEIRLLDLIYRSNICFLALPL